MLSDEIKEQRRGMITASSAHKLTGGWEAQLKPGPPRDSPHFDAIYPVIKERIIKGESILVGDVKGLFDFKIVGKSMIEPVVKAINHELSLAKTPKGLGTFARNLNVPELYEDDPDEPPEYESYWMRRGNQHEAAAVADLERYTDLTFEHTGEEQRFFKSSVIDGVGCTPDGVVFDDLDIDVITGAEIKCRMPEHHMFQFNIRDNQSMRDLDFERYCQIQFTLMVFGPQCQHWWSGSYNPFAKRPEHRLSVARITRDEPFIELLQRRVEMALDIKAEHLAWFLSLGREDIAA